MVNRLKRFALFSAQAGLGVASPVVSCWLNVIHHRHFCLDTITRLKKIFRKERKCAPLLFYQPRICLAMSSAAPSNRVIAGARRKIRKTSRRRSFRRCRAFFASRFCFRSMLPPSRAMVIRVCFTSNSSGRQCGTGEFLRLSVKHDSPCACGFADASP